VYFSRALISDRVGFFSSPYHPQSVFRCAQPSIGYWGLLMSEVKWPGHKSNHWYLHLVHLGIHIVIPAFPLYMSMLWFLINCRNNFTFLPMFTTSKGKWVWKKQNSCFALWEPKYYCCVTEVVCFSMVRSHLSLLLKFCCSLTNQSIRPLLQESSPGSHSRYRDCLFI
jgi:hypothetical protein